MRTIKIISGVFGHRPEGSKYIEPKKAGDPPFTVDDEQAARLVGLKVAAYVDEDNILPDTGVATAINEVEDIAEVDNITEEEEALQEEITMHERPVYNATMKANELKEIMNEYQLPFKVGMSKADMVAALDNYFADEVDDEEGADEMPDLGVEDPVV